MGLTVGSSGRSWSAVLRLSALLALVAAGMLAARFTSLADLSSPERGLRVVEILRGSPWTPLVFVAVYVGSSALAMPGTVLTLAGGVLFGFARGTIYNTVAANLGASAAFLLARALGRDGVRRLAGRRLERLDEATRHHGLRGLLVLRLVPLVPFNALNFGSGLTAMPWRSYALATVVGILPGTVVYTLFADAMLEGSTAASREALVRVAGAGLLLILLSFLPKLLHRRSARLSGRTALLLTAALFPSAARSQGVPTDLVDPAPFDRLLANTVGPAGVDYAELGAERRYLDRYLASLAALSPATLEAAPRSSALAFWINAYNACMLRRVVDHYPIRAASGLLQRLQNAAARRPANSVWQIEDVFTEKHCQVAGQPRSQDEIEHEILRPMGEPRIHFAINCAALSCPPLRTEAYRSARLGPQLDDQVHRFVTDPKHFRLASEGTAVVLRLNRVLEWFGEDFGGGTGVRAFLAPYLPAADADLVRAASTRIEFFDYDWTLNDAGS